MASASASELISTAIQTTTEMQMKCVRIQRTINTYMLIVIEFGLPWRCTNTIIRTANARLLNNRMKWKSPLMFYGRETNGSAFGS